jgi:hypothetical protein
MRAKRPGPEETVSEKGFLDLAGRQPVTSTREAMLFFRDLVSSDIEWIDSRKKRFGRRAAWVRVVTLALTGASTVVLGLPYIPERASWALPMVALVTALGGLETFFNWRSRWLLMEESKYRMNRLRDDMDYHLVTTSDSGVTKEELDGYYAEQQDIWADVSRRWVEFRKLDRAPLAGPVPQPRETTP